MKVSEFVAKLQNVMEAEGDINIYIGDMEAPHLELNKTVDAEDAVIYGETYVSIEAQ